MTHQAAAALLTGFVGAVNVFLTFTFLVGVWYHSWWILVPAILLRIVFGIIGEACLEHAKRTV